MTSRAGLCVLAALLLLPRPASADATFFIGSTTTPANRAAKGFAIGAGLLIVAFEFEYSNTNEDVLDAAPSLKTGMGNVLLQTPVAIGGLQPYFTTGGGMYRERLGERQETSFGGNVGGGVKVSLAGPLRVRLDYRVLTLQGDPLHSRVHRVYAGANLKF
jgi:hypothetical protein